MSLLYRAVLTGIVALFTEFFLLLIFLGFLVGFGLVSEAGVDEDFVSYFRRFVSQDLMVGLPYSLVMTCVFSVLLVSLARWTGSLDRPFILSALGLILGALLTYGSMQFIGHLINDQVFAMTFAFLTMLISGTLAGAMGGWVLSRANRMLQRRQATTSGSARPRS